MALNGMPMAQPYTEPETNPTDDMEANESHNLSQNSTNCDKSQELNLCKLLKGHEGETFFCTACGNVIFSEILTLGQLKPLHFNAGTIHCYTDSMGISYKDGLPIIFPSRALNEQYPLDPYTAWMKWKEQNSHWLSVTVWIDKLECESDIAFDTNKIHFRTPADRDKCIEKIMAIIEKYSKK